MIPKSGNRFSDKIMLKTKNLGRDPTGSDHGLEHDPEKWKPVFGQNMLKKGKFPVCAAAAIR
jgi:hypothetical protein